MRAGTELDNLVDAGVFVENSGFQKRHPEFPGGFDLYDVTFEVQGKMFAGRLYIGIDDRGRRRLYDLTKIKSLDPEVWVKQHGAAAHGVHQSSDSIISENTSESNTKYSLPSRVPLKPTSSHGRKPIRLRSTRRRRKATAEAGSRTRCSETRSPTPSSV